MTILFVGGEQGDFHGCGMSVDTSGTYHVSARARCALGGQNSQRATVNLASSAADIWTHHRRYWRGFNGGDGTWFTLVEFGDAVGSRYRVAWRGSTSTYQLEYLSGGTTWTSYASYAAAALPSGGAVTYDTRLTVSASGFFGLYIDGLLVASFTGNTTISAAVSGVTNVAFVAAANDGTTTYQHWLSEFIVADEDIRGLFVNRLSPSAAGATSDWTGSYTEIDDITRDDSDNISSATANQETQVALSDLSGTVGTVRGVYVKVRAAKGPTGPQGIQVGLRIGSTNYLSGTLTPIGVYMPLQYEMATNPATSAAWTVSDLNSAQLAVKSIT